MKKNLFPSSQYFLFLVLRASKINQSENGFIIFITIGMVLLLGFLWTASALVSKVDTLRTDSSENSNTGFYLAERGLNKRAQQIRRRFEGYNLPTGSPVINWQACLDNLTANDGSGDFACEPEYYIRREDGQYTWSNTPPTSGSSRLVQRVTTLMRQNPNNPLLIRIPSDEPFANLNALEYRYTVDSVANSNPSRPNLPSAILGLQFNSRVVPLFQFMAFYQNDADFIYPPNITLAGPVHSNGDLYLNAADSSTMTVNGSVSTVGSLYRGAKSLAASSACGGTVQIADASNTLQNLNCNGSNRTPYNRTTTSPSNISSWGGRIAIGVQTLSPPPPGDFEPQPGGEYWDNADLRLVLDLTGSAPVVNVENQDRTVNVNATNAIRACVPQTAGVTARALLSGGMVNASGTTLSVSTGMANRFRVGDPLIITDAAGNWKDFDSNVAIIPPASVTPSPTVIGNIGAKFSADTTTTNLSLNSLTTRRQLNGVTDASELTPSSTTFSGATGDYVQRAVVSTSNTFYNYREKYVGSSWNTPSPTTGAQGQYIRMINVDVRELITCANNNSDIMSGKQIDDSTEGGLVWFFTVRGPNDNTNVRSGGQPNQYGVRLYNGKYLWPSSGPSRTVQGLTVVSDQAVYIQGDYNAKLSGQTGAGAPTPPSGTTIWRPAAILADTINVLSNAWMLDDINSTNYNAGIPDTSSSGREKYICVHGTGGANSCSSTEQSVTQINSTAGFTDSTTGRNFFYKPLPSSTFINAAFLSGTEIAGGSNGSSTQGSNPSGGIENYPRFHEHWPGRTFTYRGSFISLREPAKVRSGFCNPGNPRTCNIYNPPSRNWGFDTDFNNFDLLPPLTPRAVYLRQERFNRSYDRASLNLVPNPFAFLPSPSFNFGLTVPGQR